MPRSAQERLLVFERAADALASARAQLRWAGGATAARTHLRKRIREGDLPARASLADYEARIAEILRRDEATIFCDGDSEPPTVLAAFHISGHLWVVVLSTRTIGEIVTAFLVSRGWQYFETHEKLGRASEVLKWRKE